MGVRSTSASSKPDPRQLSMFDLTLAANDVGETAEPVKSAPPRVSHARRRLTSAQSTRPIASSPIRVITIQDLPSYANELVEQIDATIAALPSERLWFTYNDIRRCFGVSRATIARRMKEALVPGLRIQDGRMLEDGAVRRLDRTQLRWLLLAVQHRHAQPAPLAKEPDARSSDAGNSLVR